MFKCLKAVLAATLIFSVLHYSNNASAQTVPPCPTIGKNLTAAQCTKLRSDLDKYIVYVNAWLAAQPAAKQVKLKPYVDAAIAEAKRLVNKACPLPTQPIMFECIVVNFQQTANVSLGISNATLGLTSDINIAQKPVCVSSNACLNIASQKFNVVGTLQSVRCNPVDAAVVPLTDAEVQTKINAIP